ncbi:MAG TPA: MFS transporter [Candidatus Kryptonia bacterium]|nr:MFS transporter [Candidatus Kryptonia bacterium]
MDLRRKLRWVAVLYFAEGFPFGITTDNLPVYFRTHGVSLVEIGLLSLLGLPWTLKVLWSPLVDRFGERRQWMTGALLLMAVLLAALPLLDPARPTWWLWALLLAFTTASATQDIAIDAYTIGLLASGEEGVANGVRVSAYRAALIVGGGGLVILADTIGWRMVFWSAAAMLLLLAGSIWRSPRVTVARGDSDAAWFAPLWAWLRRPGAPLIFLFVLTYKLGDASMGPMVKPFWVDRGFSVQEIGLVSTTFGVFASVFGALVGGVLTTRWGIFRGLWALGLLQAFSNLGYAAAAYGDAGRIGIYSASLFESFTGGLGTAAFLAFLMHICDKRQAATEYALLSAIFGFTRSLAGGVSGWGTTSLGYPMYFAFTFVLAFPAYALLPWVKEWITDAPAELSG